MALVPGKASITALGILLGAAFFASLTGCDEKPVEPYRPKFSAEAPKTVAAAEYVIGVHPLHNPRRLALTFGPLADLLSERIPGTRFRIEASRDYDTYEKKLYARAYAFAIPNPLQTLKSLDHGYRVVGKMGDDEHFRGLILVRRDSGITSVADLRGRAVSFPAPTALAATLMPQFYLHRQGLDIARDIEVRYVGSQESSIMNVYLGNVAAGATWPPPWRHFSAERPTIAEALEPIWLTESLPNNGVVVRDDVPQDIVDRFGEVIFSLHDSELGRRILAGLELSRFERATESTYDPVRSFLQDFSLNVRNLDPRP